MLGVEPGVEEGTQLARAACRMSWVEIQSVELSQDAIESLLPAGAQVVMAGARARGIDNRLTPGDVSRRDIGLI